MINLVDNVRSSEYFKANTDEVISQIGIKRSHIVITQDGEAKAVLMDVKSYQNLIDSINLMKIISIGENDFNSGRFICNDELDSKIKKII
jgi:PHD/YefM family antitoxin component YafN of YafNO toxin-antitoxin module